MQQVDTINKTKLKNCLSRRKKKSLRIFAEKQISLKIVTVTQKNRNL